jgi:hypothetical protein
MQKVSTVVLALVVVIMSVVISESTNVVSGNSVNRTVASFYNRVTVIFDKLSSEAASLGIHNNQYSQKRF